MAPTSCRQKKTRIARTIDSEGVAKFIRNHAGSECTTPSHSQSLANFVANVHSQGISAARMKFCNFIRKTIRIR